MTFDSENFVLPSANIKVIGIGGGGGNAVNTMIRTNIEGVDFVAANTDVQALRFSLADTKIQIGKDLTKGLGAGADPDIGRDAMLEDRHAIAEALEGAHMVFVTAGMGGGTGTGGAAVAAQIAREMGALTVGVVTKPFGFEGNRRKRLAEEGIARLREQVDTLITIPNDRLLQISSPDLTMIDAFRLADNVLVNAVKGISDIINIPGILNVDFADVKTIMSSMGLALMGIGTATGENRAVNAAKHAISSPLLEDIDIEGATGILINITSGEQVSLHEVNEACSIIQEAAHEDANIIFGAVIDENITNEIRVTVIATGFPVEENLSPRGYGSRSRSKSFHSQSDSMKEARKLDHEPTKMVAQNIFGSLGTSKPEVSEPKIEESLKATKPTEAENLARLTLSSDSTEIDELDEIIEEQQQDDHTDEAENLNLRPEGATSRDLSQSKEDGDEPRIDDLETQSEDRDDEKTFDMDKKIDEALKMAEQISLAPKDQDDDLDVPSFLRREDKDLNLS